MYGLLLENLSEYIKSVYGEEKWDDIRRQTGISSPSFSVHDDYDENLLIQLAAKAQEVSHTITIHPFTYYLHEIYLPLFIRSIFADPWSIRT